MMILETERLSVKTLELQDAGFIQELTNSPGWLQFIGDRGIKNTTDAENYIINGPMASYQQHGHGLYLMEIKATGTPVGICGLLQRATLADKDIGFALLPEHTGNGYALEAAAAIMRYAREVQGIQKIAAITLPSNQRSIQLLGKLGLVFEKQVRFPGDKEDLLLFGNMPVAAG